MCINANPFWTFQLHFTEDKGKSVTHFLFWQTTLQGDVYLQLEDAKDEHMCSVVLCFGVV